MFIKHQKEMSDSKALLNAVMITFIVGSLDYVLIRDHPNIIETSEPFDLDGDGEEDIDLDKLLNGEDREEDKEDKEDKEKPNINFTVPTINRYPNQKYYGHGLPEQLYTTDSFRPAF